MTGQPAPDQPAGLGRLVTALLTPCDPESGTVDLAAVRSLVDFQRARGVDGLFVLGTAGQGPLLARPERQAVLEAVVEAAAGMSVTCHVGAASTQETLALLAHAAGAGATAVAAVPPVYYQPDRRAVDAFYRELLASSPLPVYAYDNPRATGCELTVDQCADLVSAGLAGVKLARADLSHLQELVWAGVPVWTANAELNLAGYHAGARGCVSTVTNLAPELFDRLRAAFDAVEPVASDLQRRVSRFARAVRSPIIGGLHYGAGLRGQPAGVPRRPLRLPEPAERASIEHALAAEGLQ